MERLAEWMNEEETEVSITHYKMRDAMIRLAQYEDTGLMPEEVEKLSFSSNFFEDLYDLCNRVYSEKPDVKSFNEYVKSLILKDLEN
ncbi:MAG: hypothetical protein ACRDBO_09465 [Lachnospiraceae bacterium]